MLTGSVPFSADTPLAVALKQVSEPPRPPRELVATTPVELERVVLHALAKQPGERPSDGHEFRRELQATAEALGLEYADSTLSPSMDALRQAGTESPSGRLVIDLATLRQVQAASSGDRLLSPVRQQSEPGSAAAETRKRREFARMNVALGKSHPKVSGANSSREPRSQRGPRIAAAAIVLIAITGSGVLALRWWRGQAPANANQAVTANANTSQAANANTADAASPNPTATPTPSPSPATKPVKKPMPRKEEKKPSKIKSFFNKILRRK